MDVDGVCRILLALMSADIEAQRLKHRESAGADAHNPHWVKVVVPLGPPDECITAWFRDHGPPGRGKPDQMNVSMVKAKDGHRKGLHSHSLQFRTASLSCYPSMRIGAILFHLVAVGAADLKVQVEVDFCATRLIDYIIIYIVFTYIYIHTHI